MHNSGYWSWAIRYFCMVTQNTMVEPRSNYGWTMLEPWFDNHGFETFLVSFAVKTANHGHEQRNAYVHDVVASWLLHHGASSTTDLTMVQPWFNYHGWTMARPWFNKDLSMVIVPWFVYHGMTPRCKWKFRTKFEIKRRKQKNVQKF